MRSVAFVVLGLVLVPGVAAAQKGGAEKGATKPAGPARSSTQFTLRREAAGGADAQIARSRARAGDCAGALAAFDAAINITVDPALNRDRGLCHEKLGHPYPAIDDYRTYLTARPEAPDAEQIRQRLAQLEEQVGVGGPSSQSIKEQEPESGDGSGAGGKAEASGSVSIGSGGAQAKTKASSTGNAAEEQREPGRSYDYYAAQEKKADEAEESPLRHGEGVIIGAFLHFPRWFLGEGGASDAAYGVGGALRWSTGPMISLIGEVGYVGIGTSGSNTSSGGPLLMGGVELRFPLNRFASDQFLFRGGLGYERYTVSGTRIATNTLLGRFGLGFRHVFGPSLAFEILFDGGPGYAIPGVGDSRFVGLVGASAGLMVAF